MKKYIPILLILLCLIGTSCVIPMFAEDAVAYLAFNGSDANDGLTDQTPKKSLGQPNGNGVMSLLPNGGTLVVVQKMYFGTSYVFNLDGPLTVTAVYNGKDYRNREPATNPASGQIRGASNVVIGIKSDLTLENILLFNNASNVYFRVDSGATFTVRDSVECTVTTGKKYYDIKVDEGGTVILEGGIFNSITGNGTIINRGAIIQNCEHRYDEGVLTSEATCTNPAVKTFTCLICGHTDPRPLGEALGHDLIVVAPEQPATCTVPGSTAALKCQRDECTYTEGGEEIPTNDAHNFGEWVVTTPASPGVAGEETHTCAACGKTETRRIDPLPVQNDNRKLIVLVTGRHKDNYTVRFNTVGASKIASQTVKKGTSAAEPAAPAKIGFRFIGWYRDARYSAPYDFASPVKTDVTLYAKYVWVS